MPEKKLRRCKRFERWYGDGSIMAVVKMYQNGLTHQQVAQKLSEKHPISVPQLTVYIKTFISFYVYPSEVVTRYYFGYRKNDLYLTAQEMVAEMRERQVVFDVLDKESKIVHHDFRQTPSEFIRA